MSKTETKEMEGEFNVNDPESVNNYLKQKGFAPETVGDKIEMFATLLISNGKLKLENKELRSELQKAKELNGELVDEIKELRKFDDKARVYATKSGKLYIKPFDLFSLKKVQDLITKIANGKQR